MAVHIQPRHWHVLHLFPHCESQSLTLVSSCIHTFHQAVWGLRVMMQLHRVGDWYLLVAHNHHSLETMATFRLAEIFTVMMTCCSPAERKAAREESRRRQELSSHHQTLFVCSAQNRSGNKLALADEYVWLVFNTSILLSFCFTCPLLTVFFSLYLTTKVVWPYVKMVIILICSLAHCRHAELEEVLPGARRPA